MTTAHRAGSIKSIMSKLVIVESPTKAKTISKFLGRDYAVTSSFGHVRDLPKSKMGIKIEGGSFEPEYIVPRDKTKIVAELKEKAKRAESVIFATDEDREGEAISWHLAEILKLDPEKIKRIVFHEITKHAVEEALAHPRHLDLHLVDAQQARRVLDRLVGYELSPLLWKKVAKGLSAGRVQSVAVRLVVERERERQNFKTEEYWTLEGLFRAQETEFPALLHAIGNNVLDKLDLKNKAQIDGILKNLDGASYKVASVEQKAATREPSAPYRTSTLQQDANHKLGMSSAQSMRIAQQLYEGVELGSEGHVGLITYMRTDSTNLSEKFLNEAAAYITEAFGKKYALAKPRVFSKKARGAQEAHEAIRPAEAARTPDSIKTHLTPQQYKLYNLIWRRAVATQMTAATLDATTIDITAQQYIFRATGQIIKFDGWLKLYPQNVKENALPAIRKNDSVTCVALKPEQHMTEPPARYSDATLVKTMEKLGIGRPSTYAPTIHTIEERNYVERDEAKRLKPTDIAFVVNDLLVEHFPSIVDFDFTAAMEKQFDEIEDGDKEWKPVIREFYEPFKKLLDEKMQEINKKEVTEEKTDAVCEKCGKPMVIKIGRFGKFLACTGYPECKNTKDLDENGHIEAPEVTEEVCDKCGKPMAVKHGRFGTFMGCTGYPNCKNIKRIEKGTGVTCPACGKGEIVEKRSKRGKNFYSCNRYPDCIFALWSKPTGEKCPSGHLLVFGTKNTIKCSEKTCTYQKPA